MQTDHVRAENKISGTVLLTLNVGILKSEIGIVAYGTPTEIEQAINELRTQGECEWLVASNAADFFISSSPMLSVFAVSRVKDEGKCS
jgi:hypothetical protein